jgi:uncharacterized membrane protein YfcA
VTLTGPVILAGAVLGGFVSGLAGFGTGLVAMGPWLQVVPPPVAASLVALCSVVSQVQTIRTVWHAIDFRRLWPMLLAGVLGVPLGAHLLTRVDAHAFRIAVGIVLVVFTAVMLLGRPRPAARTTGMAANALVGLGGGVLGGLAGLSGVLPTMWATLHGWEKDHRRGVFQAFNLTVLASALAAQAAIGLVGPAVLHAALWALPGTLGGAWLGARAYRRLSDRHFDRVVLSLLAASGLMLVWQGLRG